MSSIPLVSEVRSIADLQPGQHAPILILDRDDKQRRDLGQIIRRVLGAPDFSDSLSSLDKSGEYDLIVVNYDNLTKEEQNELIERFSPQKACQTRLLLISEHHAHEDYVRLFGT